MMDKLPKPEAELNSDYFQYFDQKTTVYLSDEKESIYMTRK